MVNDDGPVAVVHSPYSGQVLVIIQKLLKLDLKRGVFLDEKHGIVGQLVILHAIPAKQPCHQQDR